jgi:uncharacterized membrane protein YhaH (DUF805 family)
MDFMNLFLSPKGRIGQKEFWIGIVAIFAIGFVVGMALGTSQPMINTVVSIILLYPGYCVMAKRFQDMGKAPLLAAIPYGLFAAVNVFALLGVLGVTGGAAAGSDAAAAGGMAALAGAGLFAIIGFVVWLVFVIWAGVAKGDAGPNAYGPPPGGAAAA